MGIVNYEIWRPVIAMWVWVVGPSKQQIICIIHFVLIRLVKSIWNWKAK